MWGAGFAGNSPPISLLILFFNPRIISKATIPIGSERARRWFVLERPRCDISGESETEVTETSKQHAQRKSQYSMMMFITYRYQSAGKISGGFWFWEWSPCLHVLSPERFNGQEEQGGGGPAAI